MLRLPIHPNFFLLFLILFLCQDSNFHFRVFWVHWVSLRFVVRCFRVNFLCEKVIFLFLVDSSWFCSDCLWCCAWRFWVDCWWLVIFVWEFLSWWRRGTSFRFVPSCRWLFPLLLLFWLAIWGDCCILVPFCVVLSWVLLFLTGRRWGRVLLAFLFQVDIFFPRVVFVFRILLFNSWVLLFLPLWHRYYILIWWPNVPFLWVFRWIRFRGWHFNFLVCFFYLSWLRCCHWVCSFLVVVLWDWFWFSRFIFRSFGSCRWVVSFFVTLSSFCFRDWPRSSGFIVACCSSGLRPFASLSTRGRVSCNGFRAIRFSGSGLWACFIRGFCPSRWLCSWASRAVCWVCPLRAVSFSWCRGLVWFGLRRWWPGTSCRSVLLVFLLWFSVVVLFDSWCWADRSLF